MVCHRAAACLRYIFCADTIFIDWMETMCVAIYNKTRCPTIFALLSTHLCTKFHKLYISFSDHSFGAAIHIIWTIDVDTHLLHRYSFCLHDVCLRLYTFVRVHILCIIRALQTKHECPLNSASEAGHRPTPVLMCKANDMVDIALCCFHGRYGLSKSRY